MPVRECERCTARVKPYAERTRAAAPVIHQPGRPAAHPDEGTLREAAPTEAEAAGRCALPQRQRCRAAGVIAAVLGCSTLPGPLLVRSNLRRWYAARHRYPLRGSAELGELVRALVEVSASCPWARVQLARALSSRRTWRLVHQTKLRALVGAEGLASQWLESCGWQLSSFLQNGTHEVRKPVTTSCRTLSPCHPARRKEGEENQRALAMSCFLFI